MERGPERGTVREWRRPGLSSSREKPPENETKDRIMPRFGGVLRDFKVAEQGIQMDPKQANTSGDGRYLGECQGRKREGGAQSQKTAADAGMRRGAQGRDAEDGG